MPLPRIRVLIVDDDSVCSEYLRGILECKLNEIAIYDISVRRSAEDVLSEFKEGVRYDIIFTDIEMGSISGDAMAEEIHNKYGSDVRIVAVTSTYDISNSDQYKKVGISACLNKPPNCDLVRVILKDTIAEMEEHVNTVIL